MHPTASSVLKLCGLCLLLSSLLCTSVAIAETFKVDTIHSYIMFRVKHLGIGFTYGQFVGVTGAFTFDAPSLAGSSIEMQVPAKNIYTGDIKRDNHLRSPDFFNIEKYPSIRFKGKLVKTAVADTYSMIGDLTILGVSRPVKAKVRQTGNGKDPQGNYRRGFETRFTVKRSEFGMNFMLGSVSDDIDLTISVEGTKE